MISMISDRALTEQRDAALSWREVDPRLVAAGLQFIDTASPKTLLHMLFHGGVSADLGWRRLDDGELVVDAGVTFSCDVPLVDSLDLGLGSFIDTDDPVTAGADICRLVEEWNLCPVQFDADPDGETVWTCFELWFLDPSNFRAHDLARAALNEDLETCRLDEMVFQEWVYGVWDELERGDEEAKRDAA